MLVFAVMFLILPAAFFVREAKAEEPMGLVSMPALVTEISAKQAEALTCTIWYGTEGPCTPEAVAEITKLTFKDLIGPQLKAMAITTVVSTFQYVLDNLAYQSAVWIATGGEGETPLFDGRDPREAWASFGLDVAGDAIGSLSENLTEFLDVDFNLCAPPDPLVRASLALGIRSTYKASRPKCDWQSIQSNWEGFANTISQTTDDPTGTILNELAKGLSPGQNSLAYMVQVNMKVSEKVVEQRQNLWEQFIQNQGYSGVKDLVTGQAVTPADMVQNSFNKQFQAAQEGKLDVMKEAALENSDVLIAMLRQTTSVFLTTLLENGLKRLKNGLLPTAEYADPFSDSGVGSFGRKEAEEFYSDLISTTPTSLDEYSVLTQFVSCPNSTTLVRQTNNCVMDNSMFDIVIRSTAGTSTTVAQAIADGKIHGDWVLYPPEDLTHNQDPYCYSYGYCYGNLVKLRKARIVPVGWEMAAASEQNLSSNPITLSEVMAGFNDCNSDNKLDSEHPWCHLVDPNWVIKYPEQRCDASMNSEQLISADLAGRSGSCVDDPSCIGEDDDGNCLGYGYCVREKNTWNFNGDSCPEQYASCMSFTNSETSAKNSWLFNTLDQGECAAANAGCLWYRTNKFLSSADTAVDVDDDTFEWLPTNDAYLTSARENDVLRFDASGVPSARTTYYGYDSDSDGVLENTYDVYSFEDRIYFNSEIEACSEESAGCSELFPINDTLSLNLIRNASFEDDEDDDGVADFWGVDSSGVTYDESGSYDFDGTDEYSLTGGANLIQGQIHLQPNRFYTLSFYAEGTTSSSSATLSLNLRDSDNNNIDLTGYSTDCTVVGQNVVRLATSSSLGTGSYASYDCTFTTPSLSDGRAWIVGELTVEGTGVVRVDAIQLEAREVPSDFHNDYNNTAVAEYLKLAPAWLGCEGESTDPEDCANYTQVCSAAEVGCSLYTPADGDPDVPAIISTADQCPSACVGYATYKQEATDYDSEDFPLYFIADSAQNCSSSYIGCDEFTNLETEEIESYSYLRACVTPEMDSGEVFFTWEGSDAAGYQLVSYVLLGSNLTDAPCISWSVATPEALTCVENSSTTSAIAADTECSSHDDILTEPDCREFYDSEGVIHYRRYSETVSVSDDCVAYRKTDSNEEDCEYSGGYFTTAGECRYYLESNESTSCPESMAGCREYTGGSSRNSSSILTEYFEDGTFDDYTAFHSTLAISNESVAVDGHSLRVTASSAGARISITPDNLVAGKTYVLKFWAKGTGDIRTLFTDDAGSGDDHYFSTASTSLSTSWQLYEVGPLITVGDDFEDFDETAELAFMFETSGQIVYLDNIDLVQTEENLTLIKDSWVTPSTCDENAAGASSPQYYLGCEEYTDQDNLTYYIYQFGHLCSESVVGCEAYYDTQNSESAYTQVYNASCFTSDGLTVSLATPCYLDEDEDEVCTIIAGRNNCQFNIDGDIPVPLPINIVLGPETVYVPADEVVYLVANDDYSCTSDNMGCTEVGVPTFSQDHTVVESFESTYLLNQPDSYDDILCSDDELFCAEWASTQDGNYYFKDPGDQDCEYKTGVSIGGVSYSGWFRTGGSTEFCYGTGYCSENTSTACSNDADCAAANRGTCVINSGSYIKNGNESGIWYSGDSNYTGWAGVCSANYDLCSEFIEPLATEEGNNPEGTSYFYLDNKTIAEDNKSTTDRCEGQVSLLDGCVLFFDSMNTNYDYSASASYTASEHADILFGEDPRSSQDPISCPDGGEFTLYTGATVDLCANRCLYEIDGGDEIVNLWGEEDTTNNYFWGLSCTSDNDCQIGKNQSNQEVEGTCENTEDYYVSGNDTTNEFVLENDTNRVLKVYRDRQCAEWLDCNNSYESWDEKTNTWVSVCQEIGLCDEYSSSGGQNFCSSWADEPAVVLDSDKYSSRDVSWYGMDYAGSAIPSLLPVQYLTQYNIAPSGYCFNAGVIYSPLAGCNTGSDCRFIGAAATCEDIEDLADDYDINPDQWYLVYQAGTCDTADGISCTAGFCTDTGRSCSIDSQCPGGECIVGYCEAAWADSYCADDSDCLDYDSTGGLECESGSCVQIITTSSTDSSQRTCTLDSDCGSSPTSLGLIPECVPGALAKTGTCYDNSCLVDRDGTPFDPEYAEAKACRGYPEIDSPFPASKIVDHWLNPDEYGSSTAGNDDPPTSSDSVPYDYVYGFRDTPVCAPVPVLAGTCSDSGGSCFGDNECSDGETCVGAIFSESDDCLCSYEKATYGQGATRRYYALDTTRNDVLTGVCMGGDNSGLECTAGGDECGDMGNCELLKRLDAVYGWDGYCLERDISSPLFGSTEDKDRACVTWLPVDKLMGSRDAYANDTDAGYPITDTYYCTEVGYYADLYPLGTIMSSSDGSIQGMEYACATATGANNDYGSYGDDGCYNDAYCPEGWVALVGWTDSDGIGSCTSTGDGCDDGTWCKRGSHRSSADEEKVDLIISSALDDCPYFCVPENSVHSEGDDIGESCDDDIDSADHGTGQTEFGNGHNYYKFGALHDWNDSGDNVSVEDKFSDCVLRGVPVAGGGDYDLNWLSTMGVSSLGQETSGGYGTAFTLNGSRGSFGIVHRPIGGKFNRCSNNGLACEEEGSFCSGDPSVVCPNICAMIFPPIATAVADPLFATCVAACELWSVFVSDSGECESVVIGEDTPYNSGSIYPYLACEELVQASTTDMSDANRSWTNRVWSANPYQYSTTTTFTDGSGAETEEFAYTYSDTPTGLFGQALYGEYYSGGQLSGFGDHSWPLPVASCKVDPDEVGTVGLVIMPSGSTSCTDSTWYPSSAQYETSDGTILSDGEPNALAKSFEDWDMADEEAAWEAITDTDSSLDYSGGFQSLGSSSHSNPTSVTGLLNQLFAKVYDRLVWNTDEHRYESQGLDIEGTAYSYESDITNSGDTHGITPNNRNHPPTPPLIASVGSCYGSQCLEANEGKFSVNGYDSDELFGSGGAYRANVTFFAWANNNQMPIRNVTVDWGDGDRINGTYSGYNWPLDTQSGTLTDDSSYYKNRRGLADRNDPQCGDPDEFGLSNSACTTGYFSFNYDYTCSEAKAANLVECAWADEETGRLLNSPCTGGVIGDEAEGKCVFQPRVHVKDNWGWCTGECDTNLNGTAPYCYGDLECGTDYCPSVQDSDGDGLFDEYSSRCADGYSGREGNLANPWVNYDGVIILDWQNE